MGTGTGNAKPSSPWQSTVAVPTEGSAKGESTGGTLKPTQRPPGKQQ